jgi:CheY-like chemotaxis protein
VEWLEPQLLIADDDRDFRESIGEVFSRRGYVTRLAADGVEALEIVQESSTFHLILLDVHMPRLTGLEALEKLRIEQLSAAPCILMSARMDDWIVQQAQQLQISSLLTKPFSLKSLTTTVESVLRSSYGWDI